MRERIAGISSRCVLRTCIYGIALCWLASPGGAVQSKAEPASRVGVGLDDRKSGGASLVRMGDGGETPAQAEPISLAFPGYFYDAGGRREVAESPDEALVYVRPSPGRTAAARPAELPDRARRLGAPPALEATEDLLERRGFYLVRGHAIDEVQQIAGVEYALPVLYRAGSQVPIYQTNQVVAAFRPEVDEQTRQNFAESCGCDIRRSPWGQNRYILTVRDTRTVSPVAVANALHERRDLTVYAEPDFILPKVAYSPPVIADPYYLSHQWHLDGDVAKGADPGSDINVETAWDTVNGPNAEGVATVRVGVLDECVEKLHPDLFPNWAAGLDLDNEPPDDDPSPDAGQRHGTSCAGLAVAAGNSIGVRGVAPRCGLIGVKFFGATISQTADGFYFCMDPNNDGDHSDGAAVLSNSWGYGDGTLQPSDVVTAVNNVATTGRNGRGVIILFASANDDHTVNGVSALAQLSTVMAVGGSNSHAVHTEFSDVGPEVGIVTPTNDRGDDGVRLPWLDITTVDNTGSSGYNGLPDLDYTNQFGGTSAATPIAAGALALIISQDPNMTAAQARAILQHTAVRLDEPYGRFDGISGHSHRFGFGKADAGAAITAARAGIRWPDRIKGLMAGAAGNNVSLTWDIPISDYADSILVRSNRPFAWMPTDGASYNVSDTVAPGVQVIYKGALSAYVDNVGATGGFFYGVYPRSSANRYGFGARAHVVRGATAFADNCEGPDPGWTHGGSGDEWTRGAPTSVLSAFSQAVAGSGPLTGLRGTRAIGGNNCWGTDLASTYNAFCNAYLQTPLINLTGITAPVFLEYYDWCLLETYYDTCLIEVIGTSGELLGVVDPDTGGDYDWTQRVYDLSAYAGQIIRIRFRMVSDGLLQRDGWFIDEVRVTVAGNQPLAPIAADVYAETATNAPVFLILRGTDPDAGQTLDYVVSSLPQHGTLSDPNGGAITSVPYTLLSHGYVIRYAPGMGYEGPDQFTYRVNDGALNSNTATASVSVGTPVIAYSFPLTTNPGWITEGDWAFGKPNGMSGDPLTGYTGLNVYGYNLNGAYGDFLAPQYLTALPINCTGLTRVTLRFARWLGVESSSYDNASIEASLDGVNWETVWKYIGPDLAETAWGVHSYPLGQFTDNQDFVLVRWVMGPTDSNTTFAGWNIDDVDILAIGAPQANQPPYARSIEASTAKDMDVNITLDGVDTNNDPLTYTIVSLPANGQLFDPNAGDILSTPYILAAGGQVVDYSPDPGFAGPDDFKYQVDDGSLNSNVANVNVLAVETAQFPFTEDFESGPPLRTYWTASSDNTGRIQVTSFNGPQGTYHVTMDSSREATYSSNELTLAADLEGQSYVILQYDWKDFGEDVNPLPASWVGRAQGDGVAISADGMAWHRIADLFDPGRAGDGDGDGGDNGGTAPRAENYQTVSIDLDQAAADAGIAYTNAFRIRFQQYDNYAIDTDGIALDNIKLIQGASDPLIATNSLPVGIIDQAYGPVTLSAIGGDEPLSWSLLSVYDEDNLGESLFVPTGTAQNWIGRDNLFTYTLPFAFPFYGVMESNVVVAIDGWINFGTIGQVVGSPWNNSQALLTFNKRIAVLWDDLRTDLGGNVYIDTSIPQRVTFRWDAVTHSTHLPCNFGLTLFQDGRIRFDYGSGNTGLTPTIGVSAGDQQRYFISSYNSMSTLTTASSLELELSRLPAGLSLSPAGVLSGTPSVTGLFKPIFRVQDASLRADSKKLTLRIINNLFGDFDDDGDVDLFDFVELDKCVLLIDPTPECVSNFDGNGDSAVDLVDAGLFQNAFTGSP